jgi:acyl-CoA synthetase (NDP forming)
VNTDFSKFFEPSSLALLGASSDPSKWGYQILWNILRGGFKGRIYPVNPTRTEIQGVKVYPHIADIPETPDLAVIVVPPLSISEAIRDCVDKNIKAGVVITAGFAEIGRKGAELQAEMLSLARQGGMRLIGPNCFGIVSPSNNLYTQMPPVFPPAGSIAVVSQSGNVGATIARRAMALDFGISRLVSTGNEADLHLEDFYRYLGGDDKTKVILSYIEGFKDGRTFFDVAKSVSRRKPIVVIKVGETEAGASAARSHTAALSGADSVFEGVSRQAGIIRVHNMNELMNVGYGFLCHPLPKGRRVGIATLGGGWGALAADACAKMGMEIVKLPEPVIKELDNFLPAWWSRNNPVDCVAGSTENITKAIEVLARWEGTDAVVSLGLPFPRADNGARFATIEERRQQRTQQVVDHYRAAFSRVKEIMANFSKPVIVAAELFARDRAMEQEILRAVSGMEGMIYSMPDEAASVLDAMVRYSEFVRNSS